MIFFQNKVEEIINIKNKLTKQFIKHTTEVLQGKPVSKDFFIYKILAKENIHHSKTPKFCPLCEAFDADDYSHSKHKELIPIQRGQYTLDKKNIATNITPETILVTQDFSQI